MISLTPLKNHMPFDVILISGEYYDDHPDSPVGMIARVLEAKGYSVGIIEKPFDKSDFISLGKPKLFFGVTSGSIDSMLHNYTALKRKREDDPNSILTVIPDRAVTFYCNKLKEHFKDIFIVIGGIEASLRRFAHYDYWDNKVRKSILMDSRANILVYGNGEKQILEIAKRRNTSQDCSGIEGTCILSKKIPEHFQSLPSFKSVQEDNKDAKVNFCKMQVLFSNDKNLAQEYDNNYILQFKFPKYTTADLDWIYSLPFTRKLHPKSLLDIAKFSVTTHRGCLGECNFCSIALHQGNKIISRSEESILKEIKRLTEHPDFRGYIDDLGGPSANMYGMDCLTQCPKSCLQCSKLDKSHNKLIQLLRKARKIQGIEKIFIRSGVRYDLALNSPEYIKEISQHHLSGCLKIAPEHLSTKVLKLMNKDNSRLEEFLGTFMAINRSRGQSLRYYFMIGHPGDDLTEVQFLARKMKQLQNIEQFQLFTPTPMTVSTCMYWTGMNPFNLEKVDVIYDFISKKKMRDIILREVREQKDL